MKIQFSKIVPYLTSNKALFPLLVLSILLISEVGAYFIIKNRHDTQVKEYLNNLKVQWDEEYNSIIKSYKIAAKIEAQSLVANEQLKNILKLSSGKKDIAKAHNLLLEKFVDSYKANTALSFRIFQIQNASGDVLVRFQKPEAYGSNVMSFRIIESGKLLGSIEIGIDEQQIHRTLLEDFKITAYLSSGSDISALPSENKLRNIFDTKPKGLQEAIDNKQKFCFFATVDNEHYAVSVEPFFDYSEKYIGYIVFYSKDTMLPTLKKEFYLSFLFISIAILLWAILTYALLRMLRAEQQKNEALGLNETLAVQAREVEELNAELDASYEEAVQTNDVLRAQASKLEVSEEKFRQMFENMSSGVVVYETEEDGKDFIFKNINSSVERIEKINKEQIIGKRLTEVFPNVVEFGFLDVLRETYKSGKSQNFPIGFYEDDRISGWRENFIYKLSTGEVVVIYNDVTQSKQAEEKIKIAYENLKQAETNLAQSEARLQAIIQNEPECVKIMDANAHLLYMNPAGLAMIEADSLDQVRGADVVGIIAPEYRTAYARLHKRVISGEPMQMQYEVLGLKGGRRWLETHAVPMQDGDKTIHLAVTRDIEERKKSERVLKESEERLKLAVQAGGIGIWEWDIESNVLIWDDAMFALYGAKKKDFSGAYDAWISRIHKDDIEYAMQAMQDDFSGIKPYNIEFRVVHPDGSIHFLKANADSIRDENGKVIRMIGTNWDITKEKEAESILKAFNIQLEQKVEKETEKRIEKERLLIQQSKMAMMGEMIGAIAHQWRQPLTSLAISVQDTEMAMKNICIASKQMQ